MKNVSVDVTLITTNFIHSGARRRCGILGFRQLCSFQCWGEKSWHWNHCLHYFHGNWEGRSSSADPFWGMLYNGSRYKSVTDDDEHNVLANGWRCWQWCGLEAMQDKLKPHLDILDLHIFSSKLSSFHFPTFSAYHPHTNHHHHQLFKSAKLHNSELSQMLDCKCVWLNFCFYHKLESSMLTILTMSTWTRNAFETFHKFFICKFSALLFKLLFFLSFFVVVWTVIIIVFGICT